VAVRYEKRVPGELVHIDAKRLARFTRVGHRIHGDRERCSRRVGWEHVHVCIDDATRLAYLPAEHAASAVGFVQRATGRPARLGVVVQRVMTDNAWCYTRSTRQAALATLGARHLRTRPHTPRTNGKAERPHTALQRRPPLARLLELDEQRP